MPRTDRPRTDENPQRKVERPPVAYRQKTVPRPDYDRDGEQRELYVECRAQFLVYNNIDAMETIREKIGTVTRDEIVAVANEIYGTQNLSMLMYR